MAGGAGGGAGARCCCSECGARFVRGGIAVNTVPPVFIFRISYGRFIYWTSIEVAYALQRCAVGRNHTKSAG